MLPPPPAASGCPLCENRRGPAAICAGCERTYGPRVARLLARAEADPSFKAACLAHLPAPLRASFAALLSRRYFRPGREGARGPGLRSARPRVDPRWLRTAN